MNSQKHTSGAFDILELSGEIDFHHSPAVREDVLAGLDGGRNFLVDLTNVSYIDSSGIASLVEGLQHAKGKGLKFGLVGVKDGVMNVLKLTRLDKVFPMFDTVDAATKE